jgi:hypothetical protein
VAFSHTRGGFPFISHYQIWLSLSSLIGYG